MKLLGTPTSPYTRKVRILLNATGRPYELLDTRTDPGGTLLAELAPLKKVPVLVPASAPAIPDSGLIAAWLWSTHTAALQSAGFNLDPSDWTDRAQLTIVEGALDAAINHRYLQLDGFADAGYMAKQRQRALTTLGWLDGRISFARPVGGAALSLGCALDWMIFRKVADPTRWPGIATFHAAWTASGIGSGTEPHE
jgi:glutathione S-transferase